MDNKMAGQTLLKSEMVLSPAYKALTESGLRVLIVFLLKQPMEKVGPKEWIPKQTDNDMSFTYVEAEKLLGFTPPRFARAIDNVIETGFIDLKYQGGGMEGNRSSYVLIGMWKLHGTDQFRVRPRPKKGLNIGFIKKNRRKKIRAINDK
jgi:hypothetical protein